MENSEKAIHDVLSPQEDGNHFVVSDVLDLGRDDLPGLIEELVVSPVAIQLLQ